MKCLMRNLGPECRKFVICFSLLFVVVLLIFQLIVVLSIFPVNSEEHPDHGRDLLVSLCTAGVQYTQVAQ